MVEMVATFVFQEESDGELYPYTEVVRVEFDTENAARSFMLTLKGFAVRGVLGFVHYENMVSHSDEVTVGDAFDDTQVLLDEENQV